MSNYTQQKFRLGTAWGQPEGRPLWPSLRPSPGWGNCAYVARGQTSLVDAVTSSQFKFKCAFILFVFSSRHATVGHLSSCCALVSFCDREL